MVAPASGAPGCVGHHAAHQSGVAVLGSPDVLAHGPARRSRPVERPEHGRLGRPVRGVHQVDQGGQAKDVGQQDELLPLAVALLAGRGEELEPGQPLLRGQSGLDRERVQVLDQRRQQLAQPRVRRLE